MVRKIHVLFMIFLLLPFVIFAEGSKQLTPNTTGTTTNLTSASNTRAGFLAHDANFPSAAGVQISSLSFLKPSTFSRNGATFSADHRLYIRVKAGETLYYGVHRTTHDQGTGNQSDLIITIRRAASSTDVAGQIVQQTTLARNTSSTRQMLLNNGQAGVIETAAQASIGPTYTFNGVTQRSGGYRPLVLPNNTGADQDYWVEFTQVGEANLSDYQRFSVYDYWDFTVMANGTTEKPGRLYSKLWSFSSGGTSNVFSSTFSMFPLIPSEDQPNRFFVKKLELAGLAPQNFFRFVSNRFGSDASVGATFEARRKSQTSQKDYPEFSNFVNNPDPDIWPSAVAPTFSASLTSSCNTTTGGGRALFNINSSERSTVTVLVNLNGVAGYQPGTADVLVESTGSKGGRTIEWNGLNGLGQKVATNTSVTYSFKNSASPVNFPMWDAEWNDGFRVMDVRPLASGVTTGGYALLYWDDSNLPLSSFPAPQTELFGVSSASNVHSWGSATTTAGDLKTVNTWTYGFTNEVTQTATFSYDCSADVGVTNTVSAGPYTMGQPLTYTVTVINNGPIPATNVKVTDKLDATKLQFGSSSDAANYSNSTGIWNIGTLAVGESKTLTITATPLATGTIATTASQTHTEADNVTSNNSATVSITVQPSADIEVKNTSDKAVYNNGDIVSYTMTVKNVGPNAATGVTVTTNLPEGFVPYGVVPAGFDPTTRIWTAGNLAVNETKSITLQAQVTKTGSFTSTATLGSRTGYEIDTNPSNNTSSTTVTVAPAAEVAVTSSVSQPDPGQGDAITYTVKVVNNGPDNATNVSVASQLPAGVTVTGYSASSGTVNATTGTWAVGTLVTNSTQTLLVYARPTATGSLSSTFTQTHTESDSQSSNNSSTAVITVKPTADVEVTNVVSSPAQAGYANGDVVTYTVAVKNNGPSTATNVVVTDKLPAALTFVSATNSSGTGTYNATTGAWYVGTLASGASATLTLRASINQSAVITTTATHTHTEYDNVNGNNSASNTIIAGTGTVMADVKVTIGMSQMPYYTGKEMTLGVRVDNNGPDAVTGLSLEALVPAGFTFVSATPRIGTYDVTTGIWTVGNLASGSYTGLNLVVKPKVDNTTTGSKDYTFTATKYAANEADPDVSNNTASSSFTVQKAADGAVSAVVTGDVNGVFYRGVTEATFTLTITNNGPDRITNLVGYDTRTGAIDFTYVEPGKGYDATTGKWVINSLEPNQSVTLTVKGIPNTTGQLFLGGSMYSMDQQDLNTENNKAVALLTVVPVADLAVTNTAAAGPYINGQNTSFTVTVKNNSVDAATGVKIEDVLPAGLTFVSASPSAGAYDAATGIWTLGTDVLPDSTETLVLTVKPTSSTTYTTTASVKAANEYDSNSANNTASAQMAVSKSADIALSGTIVDGPYYVGGKYLVTITATNQGPDAATGVEITARMAAGLRAVAGSGTPEAGTAINAATGIWTIGTLGVNDSKKLTYLVEPVTTGVLNSYGYKSAENEFDPNGGTTRGGNNTVYVNIEVTDRAATYQLLVDNRYFIFFKNGERIATPTDPDGEITHAAIVSGVLPAGMMLENDGDIEVVDRFAIRPGTYTVTIETTDAQGDVSRNTLTFTITDDWDRGGISDLIEIDDNNDGIPDIDACGGADPYGDDDKDGQLNYYDIDYVHPVYGAFKDKNNDGINDGFDTDLDGIINSLDLDIDGDGITNVVEANGGKTSIPGYDPQTGMMTGGVNKYGVPLVVQPADSKETTFAMPDTDGDGIRDFMDVDADNDGILDNYEGQSTFGYLSPSGRDADADGIDDVYDPTCGCGRTGTIVVPVNTDGTDQPDYLDLNSDNDLYEDFIEAFDDNQDGVALDDYKARALAFEQKNGGKGQYPTLDSNKNGIPDWLERTKNTFAFLSPGNAYYYDADEDGLVDLFDADFGGTGPAQQLIKTSSGTYEYAARSSDMVVPLPVELISFTGKADKAGVILSWATASEKDNDYFQVERSADGKTFQALGQVKGGGTSTVRLEYSYIDEEPLNGVAYYRLKQVDVDTKFEYSKIIAVQLKGTASAGATTQLNLYPNPATSAVHLDLSVLPAGSAKATIFGADGRMLQQLNLESGLEQVIDVSRLAAGAYLIRLQGTGFSQTLRFIKQQ